jgi:hypothetical protein
MSHSVPREVYLNGRVDLRLIFVFSNIKRFADGNWRVKLVLFRATVHAAKAADLPKVKPISSIIYHQ